MPCNVWEFCISGRMDIRMSPNCTVWDLVFPAAIIRRNLSLRFEFHFGLDFFIFFYIINLSVSFVLMDIPDGKIYERN